MSTEGTYLNIIKTIYDKPTANIIISDEKLKAVPLRSEQGKDVHSHCFYSTLFAMTRTSKTDKKKK